MIDAISVMVSSIQDGLGPFGMVSTVRWSCIGRDLQTVRDSPLSSINRLSAAKLDCPDHDTRIYCLSWDEIAFF